MTRLRCLLAALLVALPLVVSQAGPAVACSCQADLQVEARLADSDGAFVGVMVKAVPKPPLVDRDPFQPDLQRLERQSAVNHFKVERAVKGEIGARVEVLAPASGASCGMELSVGQRAGVFLRREAGAWESSMCQKTDPDGLLAVADRAEAFSGTEKRLFLLAGLALLAVPVGLASRRAVRRRA